MKLLTLAMMLTLSIEAFGDELPFTVLKKGATQMIGAEIIFEANSHSLVRSDSAQDSDFDDLY